VARHGKGKGKGHNCNWAPGLNPALPILPKLEDADLPTQIAEWNRVVEQAWTAYLEERRTAFSANMGQKTEEEKNTEKKCNDYMAYYYGQQKRITGNTSVARGPSLTKGSIGRAQSDSSQTRGHGSRNQLRSSPY